MIALTTSNIYCVWYPSGSFGHFVNAILTLHGDNFVRPKKSLEFSSTGDSHSLDLIVPKYLHEFWPGGIEFVNNQNYCVLIDNGIDNESEFYDNKLLLKIYQNLWLVTIKVKILFKIM